ncbi:hypothetical protein GCM10028778_10590 [Barrientosiimonas marina]|uniref:Uncharacterized protein n=1 Tax=Lentibacillus kimchii TaxID=1542911 RepID=A0ABW2UZT4_9BACI
MENRISESTDQADELRKLVNDVEEGEQDQQTNQEQEEQQEQVTLQGLPGEDEEDDVDILDLPPRGNVHNKSKSPMKLKISRASTRLLAVIAILLLLFGTAFYFWGEALWSTIVNM